MTRSRLLAWFYHRKTGASAKEIREAFGDVSEALQGLVDLGMVFEYGYPHKKQMFKVRARWSKALELNTPDRVGYRLGKFRINSGASSSATREYVKTAAGKYVLAHR